MTPRRLDQFFMLNPKMQVVSFESECLSVVYINKGLVIKDVAGTTNIDSRVQYFV